MTGQIDETQGGANNQLASTLEDGVRHIGQNQHITFTKYVRVILPLDGYVFWVKADLLSSAALINAAQWNSISLGTGVKVVTPAATIEVLGSLHFATNQDQKEDETIAINNVVFTSEEEIDAMNEVGPNVLLLGEFQGLRFSFNQRRSFYKQSSLWHYVGNAVYPAMESQLIDFPEQLDTKNVIVSNSLPIWLALNKFMPMYPSFLVNSNIDPPYASVHISPENTRALQSVPYLDSQNSQYQLTRDLVRITMYGLRNFNALDFMRYVFEFSESGESIGIMNMPLVRDEKRTQTELNVIAMKKTVEFEVSYYQSRVRDEARQLIKTAILRHIVEV